VFRQNSLQIGAKTNINRQHNCQTHNLLTDSSKEINQLCLHIAVHDSGSHRNDTTSEVFGGTSLSKTTYQAMGGYRVLAFLVFQGMMTVCYLAVAEDAASSRSAYFTTHENQRLEGHVVEQFNSPSSISCSHSCLKNSWCTSTNFKLLSEKNGKGTCELNKHGVLDENTKFHEEDGVTFSLILKVRHWQVFILKDALFVQKDNASSPFLYQRHITRLEEFGQTFVVRPVMRL